MAKENMIARVRKGMRVHTADAHILGKVTDVWVGADPTATNPPGDEEVCSYLEVQSGGLFKRTTLYVPSRAIANVSADHVMLNRDAAPAQERPWNQKPRRGAG